MKYLLIGLAVLPLFSFPAAAQLPQPATELRAAPRASWTTVTVTGTPTQRRDNPGAASSSKLYLFGGRDGNANTTVHNALYEFDGSAWTLKTADTAAAGFPVARGGACVAWNNTTNKLLVFGGDTGTGLVGGPVVTTALLNDTWEWDPITNTWTDVTPVLPALSPSPRRNSAMTWDPATGGMLLFGGDTALTPTTPDAQTWLFLAGAWTQLNPANVPAKRQGHALVTRTDSFNDVLLCCGADDSFTTTTDRLRHLDVWTWNGSNWTKISDWDFVAQTGSHPASTTAGQAVYDPLRQRVVYQGGQGISVGSFTSSAATGTPTNTTYIYGYFNPATSQWEQYNGSPTNWTSEFDSLTNSWTLYSRKNTTPALATWGEADPVIGRASRYFAGFVPALGQIYKVSGQNPSGVGTTTGTVAYQATPVASVSNYGAGCTGPGGALALVANNLPWTGRTFQVTGSNFGPLSLGVGVIGLTQVAIPMVAILPVGGLGCDLLANPDLTQALVPAAGSVTLPFALPNTTTLAGIQLNFQVAELSFDPFLNINGLFGTNGVAATIGAL